ncbi:MAG: arabinogalactan endo-1,4-beta-galactosidase [Flavobacteriales bacterium]|nr:arabinogalactan endo-1,4-beta-galactosidase [Flavobacteriales bacterium]
MKNYFLTLCAFALLLSSCKKEKLKDIDNRNFKMGFTSWSYGPDMEDRNDTYDFIQQNGDIYAEFIDDVIPWEAWMNGTELPTGFTDDVSFKAAERPADMDMILSVSLLNTGRTDLIEGFNGEVPEYTAMNDEHIEDAYFAHLSYLIDQFNPNYLILAMEANDLLLHNEARWPEYKLLMSNIRSRVRLAYPNLKITESITLHNWYETDATDKEAYVNEITEYVKNFDLVTISFYPFFKDLRSKNEYQKAFDFLHDHVNQPIAFIETNQLAEDLDVEAFDLHLKGDEKGQARYLETLFLNAHNKNYEFVIWWAHRDFDELWETFPDDVKDIGKLWRNTGLLDKDGSKREAWELWDEMFKK